jgi:hypothetical protein
VNIACSVHPVAGGYAIDLNISQGNTMGNGASSINAHTAPGQVIDPLKGGVMNVVADVVTSTNGDYHFDTCSITFNTPTAGSPQGTNIAAGRIWAHLSCDGINRPDLMTGTPPMPNTCDAEGDLIFENCGT